MIKKNKSFRILTSSICNVLVILITLCGALYTLHCGYWYTYKIIDEAFIRKKSAHISEMTLTVDEDTTLRTLAHTLKANHFITHPYYFLIEAYMEDFKPPFKPGNYVLYSNMSTGDILQMLSTDFTDASETVSFTIPEGYTLIQIAAKLESENIVASEDFLAAAENKTYDFDFLQDLPQNTTYQLEGYLFPGTYTVRKNTTSEEIIFKMLSRFEAITSSYSTYISHSNYNLHELLTIASLIEGETTLDDERPIISGVIYNRLTTDMPLQMCTTIEYALEKHKTKLSLDNLKVDSPYNTYLNVGLPPGPICCPSEASLKAALLPVTHDYYYFVLANETSGTHTFSHTASQHHQAKITYHQSLDKNFYE